MASDDFLRRIGSGAPLKLFGLLVPIAFAAFCVIAGDLGAASLHDGDEALYATVAREMAHGGSVLTPTYWGAPFLHKPPLPYWLMASSLRFFPRAPELAARLPSAVAAVLLLLLVFLEARRLARTSAALLATAALLLNHQVLYEHAARSATFDALLALVMFAALLAGLRAARSLRWAFTFAALLGLTALIKLPMIVFPAAVVFAHHAVADRKLLPALAGRTALGLAVMALPWHLYQLTVNGRTFLDAYVRYEILGRAGALQDLGSRAFLHVQAAWMSFLPWSPLILVALVAIAAGFGMESRRSPDDARTIAIYALLVPAFFCFIAAKWPWYAIPAYPAAAVVLAVFLERALAAPARRFVPAALAAVAAFGWFLLRIQPDYAPAARASYLWPERNPLVVFGPAGHGTAGAILLVLLLVLAIAPFLGRKRKRTIAAAAGSLAALAILAWQARAVFPVPREHQSPIHRLAQRLEGRGLTRIYALGFGREARYGGRQEPLSSFYLLGIDDANVTSCAAQSDCAPTAADGSSALVVSARARDDDSSERIVSEWKAALPAAEIWQLNPARADGFERR